MATATGLVVALTGGCAFDGDSTGSGDREGAGVTDDSAPPAPETPSTPAPRSGGAVADSEACEEVRAGIDAFNAGGFDETVEHFEAALPLAEAQDDGSVQARQLVAAVRYYAELDAGLYPDAARTSPVFAKYKAITLGQCLPVDGEATEAPGTDI